MSSIDTFLLLFIIWCNKLFSIDAMNLNENVLLKLPILKLKLSVIAV